MSLSDKYLQVVAALAIAFCGGYLFSVLNLPLPWVLGSMLAMATARISGSRVRSQRGGRHLGQLVIGAVLGQYFAPEVLPVLLSNAWLILLASLFTILLSYLGGYLLSRIASIDSTTAFFSSVPGGAAEMAVLGEHFGARVDRVAMAQSLRILMVVVIVPAVIAYSGFVGHDPYTARSAGVDGYGLALFLTLCAAGGYVFSRLGVPNAYMLGSLFVSITFSVTGHTFSAMPQVFVICAQVLIGCDLGARFSPQFRSESHRFLLGVVTCALVTMLLSALLGLLMAHWAGVSPATMILATAPGGIAEMSVTAKVLKLGVPLVTSFQVARLVLLLTMTAPVRRLITAVCSSQISADAEMNK